MAYPNAKSGWDRLNGRPRWLRCKITRRWIQGDQARYLGHENQRDLILHNLDQEGIPLYSLAMVRMSHGGLAATVRVGRPSMVAVAPSSGAPAPRCAPTAVGAPPPSDELVQEALVR
jgi:hypothetical protein